MAMQKKEVTKAAESATVTGLVQDYRLEGLRGVRFLVTAIVFHLSSLTPLVGERRM